MRIRSIPEQGAYAHSPLFRDDSKCAYASFRNTSYANPMLLPGEGPGPGDRLAR
jgi:hypothetical protein